MNRSYLLSDLQKSNERLKVDTQPKFGLRDTMNTV